MRIKDIRLIASCNKVNTYYLLPKKNDCPVYRDEIKQFILDLTHSNTIEEAHKKIKDVVGYSIGSEHTISPLLESEEDARKVIEYFLSLDYESLFE